MGPYEGLTRGSYSARPHPSYKTSLVMVLFDPFVHVGANSAHARATNSQKLSFLGLAKERTEKRKSGGSWDGLLRFVR